MRYGHWWTWMLWGLLLTALRRDPCRGGRHVRQRGLSALVLETGGRLERGTAHRQRTAGGDGLRRHGARTHPIQRGHALDRRPARLHAPRGRPTSREDAPTHLRGQGTRRPSVWRGTSHGGSRSHPGLPALWRHTPAFPRPRRGGGIPPRTTPRPCSGTRELPNRRCRFHPRDVRLPPRTGHRHPPHLRTRRPNLVRPIADASPHEAATATPLGDDRFQIKGQLGLREHDENWNGEWDKEGIAFEGRVRVLAEGGSVTATDDAIWVRRANAVTLLLGAATSVVDYTDMSADPSKRVEGRPGRGGGQAVCATPSQPRSRPSAAVPAGGHRPRRHTRRSKRDRRASCRQCRGRRSAACRALLPIRTLPAHRLVAPGHAAGQSPGHLEPGSVAALGQQVDDQRQHGDELLAGGKLQPRRIARPSLRHARRLAGDGRGDGARTLRLRRVGAASQHGPVARSNARRRSVGHLAGGRRVDVPATCGTTTPTAATRFSWRSALTR